MKGKKTMKLFKAIKNFFKNSIRHAKNIHASLRFRFRIANARMKAVAACARGENYVDSGVKILIAVVIGALLLAGLYALFGDVVLPTVTQRVTDMFNFHG